MQQHTEQRTRQQITTVGWWFFLIVAGGMSIYALAHVVFGERVYRHTVAQALQAHPWGIYPHALFGSIAMAVGPLQFLASMRRQRRGLHRALGMVYVLTALVAGASGLYMAMYAFGGMTARVGFVCGALVTLLTTTLGYRAARRHDYAAHRVWITRSYAMIFSAVTFRLVVMAVLLARPDDFASAYQVAAWLSWVLHLAVAEWYLLRASQQPRSAAATHPRHAPAPTRAASVEHG